MQEKTWYYEKWVGRQASFSPRPYVKQLGPNKQVGWRKKLNGKFVNRVGWKECKSDNRVGWKKC